MLEKSHHSAPAFTTYREKPWSHKRRRTATTDVSLPGFESSHRSSRRHSRASLPIDMPSSPTTSRHRRDLSVLNLLTIIPITTNAHGVELRYLAEGAANVVFKIHYRVSVPSDSAVVFTTHRGEVLHGESFLGMVLRFSKGSAKTVDCEEIIRGFEQEVKPQFQSFEKHLMAHEAVLVDAKAIQRYASEYNLIRLGVHTNAILLPDMSSIPGKAITIEIKPKWLSQSPNAPRSARRCRTCALHESKGQEDETFVCPLRLLAKNDNIIRTWLKKKVPGAFAAASMAYDSAVIESVVNRMTQYIVCGEGQALLRHLKRLQESLDPHGILARAQRIRRMDEEEGKELDRKLRLAMTLRDCSFFIRAPLHDSPDAKIESKLGDLDFKSAKKMEDWRRKEEILVGGGWYTTPLEHSSCLISAASL